MEADTVKNYRCKLCEKYCLESEMSDEHYPARSVGNEDIVAFDIMKMIDLAESKEASNEIMKRLENGDSINEIAGDIFDNKLSKSLYLKGRTARTLCKKCNTFLGKYDEAYLKFFQVDGNPEIIKGFQQQTKYQIIKSIYAKFLSIPEAVNEKFDFIDFVKDETSNCYNGKWNLFFIKRDYSTDILGMKDIGTGMATFDEGVVYELSDDKFIFNLMNFEKHSCFDMTNIFEILNKHYNIVQGVGENGGYHASILIPRLLSESLDDDKN